MSNWAEQGRTLAAARFAEWQSPPDTFEIKDAAFTDSLSKCDNSYMLKPITKALILIAVGVMLCERGIAQQTAPSHPQPASSAQGQTAAAAKTHPVPATRPPSVLALKTQRDKASYAIGLNIGKTFTGIWWM